MIKKLLLSLLCSIVSLAMSLPGTFAAGFGVPGKIEGASLDLLIPWFSLVGTLMIMMLGIIIMFIMAFMDNKHFSKFCIATFVAALINLTIFITVMNS